LLCLFLGDGPTGVAVDDKGRIWTTNYNSGTLSRIDPNAGEKGGGNYTIGGVDLTVELPPGSEPYTYGRLRNRTHIKLNITLFPHNYLSALL
jgi:DNA-binding beta-propeller fold protein YncE